MKFRAGKDGEMNLDKTTLYGEGKNTKTAAMMNREKKST